MQYRYRYNGGTTHGAEKRFDKIIAKLGTITEIRGYRYIGRYGVTEAVLIRGTNGTARFSGLLWGYGGQGPRGTHALLLKLGVETNLAWKIAFQIPRQTQVGNDWSLLLPATPAELLCVP